MYSTSRILGGREGAYEWDISPALVRYLTENRLFVQFSGIALDEEKVVRRYYDRLTFLRTANYFVTLPPDTKINWVHHWLRQQGVAEPWRHRLRVLHAPRHEEHEMTSIYGFLPGQEAVAVHFKLRWT